MNQFTLKAAILIACATFLPQPSRCVTLQQLAKLGINVTTLAALYYGATCYFESGYNQNNDLDDDFLDYELDKDTTPVEDISVFVGVNILQNHIKTMIDNESNTELYEQALTDAKEFIKGIPNTQVKSKILSTPYNEKEMTLLKMIIEKNNENKMPSNSM